MADDNGMDYAPLDETIPPDPILQFFEYKHLPQFLQKASMPFHELAHVMHNYLPDNAERAAGLRKLLEAKDCAVRAVLCK